MWIFNTTSIKILAFLFEGVLRSVYKQRMNRKNPRKIEKVTFVKLLEPCKIVSYTSLELHDCKTTYKNNVEIDYHAHICSLPLQDYYSYFVLATTCIITKMLQDPKRFWYAPTWKSHIDTQFRLKPDKTKWKNSNWSY